MNKSFSFIGAGNVAHSLIPALQNAGYKIDSVISRSLNSAKACAEKFKVEIFSDSYNDVIKKSDIYILAVSDNEIENATKELSKLELNFPDKTFIHLSGSQNIETLKSIANKGASTASIHFMQSFPNHNFHSIENCYAAIEFSGDKLFNELNGLLIKLKTKPFRISSSNKVLYHLLGVFSLNFISANFSNAVEIQKSINEKLPNHSELFKESAKAVIDNYSKTGSLFESLSGPIKRAELEIIKNHLTILENNNNQNILLSFIANSLSLIKMIENEKGYLTEELIGIKKLLLEYLEKVNKAKL